MPMDFSAFGLSTKKKKKNNSKLDFSAFKGLTKKSDKETLDTQFQNRQTQQNASSLSKFGLNPNLASQIKGVTPMKEITAFGGRARAESYYGKDTVTPRVSINYDKFPDRKDLLGTVKTEIDHIQSKAIGGMDTEDNLKAEEAKRNLLDIIKRTPSAELEQYKRQAGRLPAELKIIDDYQKGNINQIQALEAMGNLKKTEIKFTEKDKSNLDKFLNIGKIGEKVYDIYTKTVEKGIGYLGAGVGYITGGTLEYLKSGDKDKARKQAEISAKQTQQFGEGIGKAGAEIAPVAYTAPILLDAAILYSVGTDVKSAAEESGVEYETSKSGMIATETGMRALGSRGLEKIGISSEKADELVKNPLLSGTGLFIETLLTGLASRGATTKFRNSLMKNGKFIEGKSVKLTTNQLKNVYKNAGKDIPADLPQGTWDFVMAKGTTKSKLLSDIGSQPGVFKGVKFTPSETLGTAETQLVNLNKGITKPIKSINLNAKTTTPIQAGVVSSIKPTIKISGVKPVEPPVEASQKPKTADTEVLEQKMTTDTSLEPITDLNPTGGVFVEYTPEQRMKAPLAQNITTLADTMKKSPDTIITIYRGAPEIQKEIVGGDFITTDIRSAKSYNDNVISKEVRLGDILDDIESPLGGDYLYRPGATNEIKNVKYDYTKSDWYKNYKDYLIKNKTKFPTLEKWIESNKASGKTKSQLEQIYKEANKPEVKKPTSLLEEAKKYDSVEEWEESYKTNISNEKAQLKEAILEGYSIRAKQNNLEENILDNAKEIKELKDNIKIFKKDVVIKPKGQKDWWSERYIIASKNGKIVGIADGQISDDSNLSRIFVDKDFRRQGIGTEIAKVFDAPISPRTSDTDISLLGLKTYLKSQGTSMEQIWQEAHKKPVKEELPTKEELTYKPEKEVRKETPTIKETKVGKSIETKAVDKGILSGLEEVAEYNATTIKEQTKIFDKFIGESSREDTLQVIKGNKPLPEGLKGASLLTGLENYALKNGDAEMLLELAKSPYTTETSEAGQTLRLIQERKRDSVALRLFRIKKLREARAKRQLKDRGKSDVKVKENIKKSIKKAVAKEKITKSEWENFIDEIKC